MSNRLAAPTSTTEVHHCFVRHQPVAPEQRFLSTPQQTLLPPEKCLLPTVPPQRPTSLFTVCHPQPSSVATNGPADRTVTHRAAPDVNNARSGPIVGSCSINDLTPHSGFGHIHRRFRHPKRTGRPNTGKSTNTDVTLRPHRPATALTHRTGLAGPDHHPKRCPLTPLVDPHQINLAQAYQQLAHARRDQLPQGSSCLGCVFPTPDYGGPLPTCGLLDQLAAGRIGSCRMRS